MKLVASMIVRDEMDRYLSLAVAHALTYCDEVRILDDGSTDGTYEFLTGLDRVHVARNEGTAWRAHEGHARQAAWEWTLAGWPTHVLAIDADEIVPDGAAMRTALEADETHDVWSLRMAEIWTRDPWQMRVDGGWRPHPVPIVFAVDEAAAGWSIMDRALACGRVPVEVVARARTNCGPLPLDILHLGWSDPAEREARAARYEVLDGGRFHASAHLASILDEAQVRLEAYPAPQL